MEKIPGTEKRTERGRKGGGINHERKEEIIDFFTINKENMFSKQNESILFPIGD